MMNLDSAFRSVVRLHGQRVALYYPATGERVTYSDLSSLVDRIAGLLKTRGLEKGQVAAIFHDKSAVGFAVILACLRLGVIYTNLDPESPWERVRKILSICKPALVINTFQQLLFSDEISAAGYGGFLQIGGQDDLTGSEVLSDAGPAVDSGAPAYIMFTSGSTGTPKGAVMSHANLLWFISWARGRFGITHEDVLTNVNPIYFDNSVFDFYSAIFSGATLIPFTSSQARDPRLLVQLVNKAACTLWFSVPSLLVYLLTTRALTDADFPAIRKIIFGGEGFPKVKLKQLYEMFGARMELENVYGPTECTCICSAHTVSERDFEDMSGFAPLGLLAENFDFEILPLDADDPDYGELFLRGPQVGLGYFNEPERTAKVFVQNPHHSRYIDIGYRTGDMVRKGEGGWLHFKGRADFQIKHMGYRIELEEVEAALNVLGGVNECAVIYRVAGGVMGQILAFVATDGSVVADELLERVARILPSYMVPRRIVLMSSLPKNANGKIDRAMLQAEAD